MERKIRLRIAGVPLAKERLAVQVTELDDIVVDDRDLPNSSAGKRRNDGASDTPCADDRNTRLLQLTLSGAADLRQDDMPGVSLQLRVGEAHWPVEPKPPAPRDVSLS